ncbi:MULTISPECIES: type III effector protein [unclassified Streptomyces]|uniref:type III effector protein n=1 Tax=unclassified Streptomyces TaxID=2593676 RepID=UPI002E2CC6B5|nr:type III effector protein [Streptomyces sp. NBC_00228]
MTATGQSTPARAGARSPASFLAAAAGLAAMDDALRAAQEQTPEADVARPEQALASLTSLRRVRVQFSGWETGLIETARDAGASWVDAAGPLDVASRQTAERRYARRRPDVAGTTGEQCVTATRQASAAERATATWARANVAGLRRLAGKITALDHLGPQARPVQAALHFTLGAVGAADLVEPMARMRFYGHAHHAGAVRPAGKQSDGGRRSVSAQVQVRS